MFTESANLFGEKATIPNPVAKKMTASKKAEILGCNPADQLSSKKLI